jgi:uncharacterized protein YpmS
MNPMIMKRWFILVTVLFMVALIVAIFYLEIIAISDPPEAFDSPFSKTATAVEQYNATIRVYIQATQTASVAVTQ